jgi:membrane protease YdiL (CAAX protease family)
MTAANPPLQAASPYKGLLARHPLVFFFIIAYAGSWLVWMPVVLSEGDGVGLLPFSSPLLKIVLMPAGGYLGPVLSAFIMTGMTEGREGIGRLLRRHVLWRVGIRWYLFALLGIPVIMVLGAIVLPGALASFQGLTSTIVLGYLFQFAFVFFLGGLSEEPGWRGFALPRLQPLHGPLVGSLILGIFWGFWHLPLFLITGWNPLTMLNIVLFLISATFITIILTWVFNNTKGSVLLAILGHTSINTSYAILALLFSAAIVTGALPIVIGLGAVALLLVALTRGRLGYDHYPQEEEPATATAST